MIYDLAIIGGGPAGYTAAELGGKNGLKTILFERNSLGGVCLNEGCIPTKTLLYSAKTLQMTKDSAKYGVSCENPTADLAKIIARKNKIVRKLTAGIRAKMAEATVEVILGEASIESRTPHYSLSCNNQTYTAKKLLLCTGSEATVPPILGIGEVNYWTSREALENKELPESLLVIGGGVVGIEFASFFNTLGTKVIVVEVMDEILPGMDKELAALLRTELAKKGIDFYLSSKVLSVSNEEIVIEKDNETQTLHATQILLSAGRKPISSGMKVNAFMQTSDPNVYACGDITGFSMLAHTAIREAEVAINHILGTDDQMNYGAIPAVVYTNPELAGVGKTEEALQSEHIPYTVKKLPMTYSGRFVAENEQVNGMCKVLIGENGAILGVHLLGNPASELIALAGLAIEKGMEAAELKRMIFPHPTVGEILKEVL